MRAFKLMVLLLVCGHAVLHAQSARRKALIIGNSTYANTAVFPDLKGGPINDANAIERALILAGVAKDDITVRYDVNYQDFVAALSMFRASLTEDDAALFYFSGHGFSMDGEDYLVPIDFSAFHTKSETRKTNISLHQVLDNLSKVPSRVLVLDACRTTAPLLKAAVNDADKPSVDPLVLIQGTGSLVAYSSSSGRPSRADSPGGGLSFFTYYLVHVLNQHPQTMLDALNQAKDNTSIASQNQQIPAVYNEMAYNKVTQYFSFPAALAENKSAQSVRQQIHPPPNATKTPEVSVSPRQMRLCISAGCNNLTWVGDHYDGTFDGKTAVVARYWVMEWTTNEVELIGKVVDPDPHGYRAEGVFKARISPDGTSIVDGRDEWHAGPSQGTMGFTLTWSKNQESR